jgi:hypothetical protein
MVAPSLESKDVVFEFASMGACRSSLSRSSSDGARLEPPAPTMAPYLRPAGWSRRPAARQRQSALPSVGFLACNGRVCGGKRLERNPKGRDATGEVDE